MVEALRQAVVRFNSLPPEAVPAHRERMALILRVPALQAHSTLRYAAWRDVVAAFAARRLGAGPADFGPQLLGHLALGAAVAAYEQWLGDEAADLPELLAAALGVIVWPGGDGPSGPDQATEEHVDRVLGVAAHGVHVGGVDRVPEAGGQGG
jgi:hypothetical protein